ncbi:Tim44 domain-containing protein [Motiliproteus sp.]|uniref:Tim44 domain-containing protein n=1 Tax=Motiliproteus sp. TaxID=1898955 RepID=UPI003BAB2345
MLAALFFGGAFDGIQIMDVLIIAVIAFVLFKLFARKSAQPSYAGHPRVDTEPAPHAEPQARTNTQGFQSGFNWGGQGAETETVELPSWFNERAFLDGAKGHFGQLQLAWSQNDLPTIESYCSTELYQALETERAKLGDAVLDNDLVSVLAELIGYREKDQQAQISVLFSGWMREGAGAQTTEFREVWHLTRDLSEEGADWFIVGIEQA